MTGLAVLAPGGVLTVAVPAARTATVVQAAATVTVAPSPARVVQVTQPGPRGPQGPVADPETVSSAVEAAVGAYQAGHPDTYVDVQTVPAGTWILEGDYGPYPTVTVYDQTGLQIYPDLYSTPGRTTLVFAQPTAGVAVTRRST